MINLTTGRVGPETVATTTHFIKYISVITVQSGQGDTQKYQDLHSILVRESFMKSSSLKPINYDLNNKNMLQVVATGAYHSPLPTTGAYFAQNGKIRV